MHILAAMTTSLLDRVEKLLSKTEYCSIFGFPEKPKIHLLFSKDRNEYLKDDAGFKDVRRFFKGRNIKIILSFQNPKCCISLVDTEKGDEINLTGPKFINGNINKFLENKPLEDTVFEFLVVGKSADNKTLIVPDQLAGNKILEIHGYSIKESQQV